MHREAIASHAAKAYLKHRRVAQGGLGLRTRKDVTASSLGAARVEFRGARLLSGTSCSFPAFIRSAGIVQTPASGSNSDHLAPKHSDCARRRQNCELKGTSGNAVALPEFSHEGGQIGKGHCGMMPNALTRAVRRQGHAVSYPLADALDALLNPAGSFGLLCPDRCQRLGNLGAVDCRDWSISKAAWRSRAGCWPIAGGAWRSSRSSR